MNKIYRMGLEKYIGPLLHIIHEDKTYFNRTIELPSDFQSQCEFIYLHFYSMGFGKISIFLFLKIF